MRKMILAMLLISSGFVSAAGVPTVDAANLAQAIASFQKMVQQYETMVQQLNNLRHQVDLAGKQLEAVTGTHNYSNAISSEYWNGWDDLDPTSILDQYGLTASMDYLSEYGQGARQDRIETLAKQSASTDAMLDTALGRFDEIKRLVTMIDSAEDQKAIEDLQARIQGEQAMLSNELIKVQLLEMQYRQEEEREREVRRQEPRQWLYSRGEQ